MENNAVDNSDGKQNGSSDFIFLECCHALHWMLKNESKRNNCIMCFSYNFLKRILM